MSNSLGSIAYLGGGYGLRLGSIDIKERERFSANDDTAGFLVFFISPSGEQVAYLQSGRGRGEKLEQELSYMKYGGLDKFSIKILRANELPIFSGMGVRFYYNNSEIGFGYVEDVPTTDQNGGVSIIKGIGFYKKLKDKKISYTAESESIRDILEYIGTTYFTELGISYNLSKNNAPATIISDAQWKNKSIDKIIQDLIAASNEDFDTVEYIYGVDPEGDFYFRGIQSSSPEMALFEGFNYQNSETVNDSKNIVNSVEIYRTGETTTQSTEYVGTVQDTGSIDENGTYERKFTIADFIDNETASKIANGIIQDNKDPKTRVTVEDLLMPDTGVYDFAFYTLNNKSQEQKNIISDFSSLAEWERSFLFIDVSLRYTDVFSGRVCYELSLENYLNEYMQKSVTYFNPRFLHFYIRQNTAGEYLKIIIDGIKGDANKNLLVSTDDNLVTDSEKNIVTFSRDQETSLEQAVGTPVTNEWIEIEIDLSDFFKIENIKFLVTSDDTVEILLDRMEIYTNSYMQRNLSLQNITYSFGSSSVKASDAVFGNDLITLTEKLNKVEKKNTVTYDIFSKQ